MGITLTAQGCKMQKYYTYLPNTSTEPHLSSPITMHFLLLFLLHSLIPLTPEGIHAPVTTRNIMRIEIIKIPPQAPEQILAWLKQNVHFISKALV
ncbi:hypothetical protein HRS9122_02680 [Pyrenophora teres f. teres]|nr:hypothetical protein HRS9122_02680 [Pyrenophora teres f. teres]